MNRVLSRALLLIGGAVAVGALWSWRSDAPASVPALANAARCGDGLLQDAEECDGAAFAPGVAAGALCGADCRVVRVLERCGNAVLDDEEECDGGLFRDGVPAGTCSAACRVVTAEVAPRCGDGLVNQSDEQCDGASLPASAAPGTRCSSACTLILPAQDECQECAQRSCAEQRAQVDAHRGSAGPLLECVLGAGWERWSKVAADSCARRDLLTCYCGSTDGQDCASAAPASLSGPCVAEILAATDCTASPCVAQRFMNPSHPNGKAMQYVQCQQDHCYADCFAL